MVNEVRLIDLNRACCELERFYNGYTGELRRVASEALDLISMMPEVDPESLRPKGRWIIPTKINGRSFQVPHCSVCGEVPPGVAENNNYCPHCGAKMEG